MSYTWGTRIADVFVLADKALQLGQYEAASVCFSRLVGMLTITCDAEALGRAHFGCGLSLLGARKVGLATEQFRNAFDQRVRHVEAGLSLAELLLVDQRLSDAARVCQDVLRLSPSSAKAHYILGLCQLRLGNQVEARTAFREAVDLGPDYAAAMIADTFLSLFDQPSTPHDLSKDRPLICVPLSPFMWHWIGGQIYLVNFAESLIELPLHKRPRLLLLVTIDDWETSEAIRETVIRLLACSAVKGAFDRKGNAIRPSPLLDRRRRLYRLDPDTGPNELLAKVSATFPVLYPCWGLGDFGRSIYWIPDLQHYFLPANFDIAEAQSRTTDMSGLARQQIPIVFSSNDARGSFIDLHAGSACRTYVWHFHSCIDISATAPSYNEVSSLNLPSRFYYTPNQFWQHKGHVTLFKAIRLLIDRGITVSVVCTGHGLDADGSPYIKSLFALIDRLEVGSSVKFLGLLARPLQIEVMRRACAIVQPSLFEGWSTVVEDARTLGRPLILSDLPVHIEQVGATGHFFRADDPESLADVIADTDGSLTPGPDAAREADAERDLTRRLRESADNFRRVLQAEDAIRHTTQI